MASSLLLRQLSTRSASFLWLILGFVASFLYRDDEKGRVSAARCLEAIARLVPKASRDEFLSTSSPTSSATTNTTTTTTTPTNSTTAQSQFLDVDRMVADSCKTFDVVLSKGMELNARDWEDPSVTRRLVESTETPQERIRVQRSILLQRLGMSMTSGHEALGHTKSLSSLISPSDISPDDPPPPMKKQKISKNKNQKSKNNDELETPEMALLLMRTMDQQSSSSSSPSHLLPQAVLATDMTFNMFSPNWHIRHGAVMGMLHLLKAWSTTASFSSSLPSPGLWVKDILARSLCLLILDRFGDFTSPHKTVHPIRESAGQLLAFLGTLCDSPEILNVNVALSWMRTKPIWEVRHGSCVGFKYLKLTQPELLQSCHPGLIGDAVASLLDDSDDVKMGGAQILVGVMMLEKDSSEIPNAAFKNAWDALIMTDEMSSHATDLLKLISLISKSSAGIKLLGDVDCTALFRFLDHNSSTVQIEGMKLFASILVSVTLSPSFIASLMLKLFASSRSNHQIEGQEGRRLNIARTEAFKVAVSKMKEVGQSWDGLETFVKKVVVAYFAPKHRSTRHSNLANSMKLHSQLMSPAEFTIILRSAKFLSLLHSSLGLAGLALDGIKTFLPSPFVQDVEAAIILYDKLLSSDSRLDDSLLALLTSPVPPACLHKDADRGEEVYFQLVDTLHGNATVPTPPSIPVNNTPTKPTLQQIQLNSLVVSAYSKKAPNLPDKLSKIIQTFMTAVKYENDGQRRYFNSNGLSMLIIRLIEASEERHRNALSKVSENLLAWASSDMQNASLCVSMLGKQFSGDIFSRIEGLRSGVLNLLTSESALSDPGLVAGVKLLAHIAKSLDGEGLEAITGAIPNLTCVACSHGEAKLREIASSCVVELVGKNVRGKGEESNSRGFALMLPTLRMNLSSDLGDRRQSALSVLLDFMTDLGVDGRFFVIELLPIAMSFMSDEYGEVGKVAATLFSTLIRVAPLVVLDDEGNGEDNMGSGSEGTSKEREIVKHLVHGLPLPKLRFSQKVSASMKDLILRPYQEEGVTWLDFLFSVGLNGVLSDEMGLGKTIQALVAIAMRMADHGENVKSLIVCPSTLCSHWVSETEKFFDDSIFHPLLYTGSSKDRERMRQEGAFKTSNLVVTSYAVMRSDIDFLTEIGGLSTLVLDEGHLLKNPNTATAKAARRFRATHKLILTGTPVQNRVEELWATFDFLMPSFLGSAKKFMREYGKIIGDSLSDGEEALMGGEAREKLKALHQQVLPFILRREKKDVLKELPAKIITDVSCELSKAQKKLYKRLQSYMKKKGSSSSVGGLEETSVLKCLLYLRLLCVHPILVEGGVEWEGDLGGGEDQGGDEDDIFGSNDKRNRYGDLDDSGKLSVLMELLVSSGIVADDRVTAADRDTSSIFVDADTVDDLMDLEDEEMNVLERRRGEGGEGDEEEEEEEEEVVNGGALEQVRKRKDGKPSKCLIFAQHTKSLDAVEEFLFKPHLPSLRYLRLDGRVPANERFGIAETFNKEEDVRVLLLTTKVGGLGLNLTGANVVIFLEHDYNPINDLQAMDRAHRIGQKECVSVYRLVTKNTIEEKIMNLQRAKVRMGDSIVNTDNSSMFAMGTERLLDLFDLEEVEGEAAEDDAGVEGVVEELWEGDHEGVARIVVENDKGDFDHLGVEAFVDDRLGTDKT